MEMSALAHQLLPKNYKLPEIYAPPERLSACSDIRDKQSLTPITNSLTSLLLPERLLLLLENR